MILGLDISTSTIGFTLLNLTGSVEYINYIKPEGNNIFEKVASATRSIDAYIWPYVQINGPIKAIYAEAPNIMFQRGFSSAQTIATILRFNGAFLFTLYQKFNILPKEVFATSARKQVIGIGRFKLDPKEEVFKWVNSHIKYTYPHFWPIISKGKNKGKLLHECFDMADSYIIAKYGLICESGNLQS